MIGLGMSALKVYLAVEPCDMRKGFNGLTIAATEHLGQALASDSLFVFVNKRQKQLSFSIPFRHRDHCIPVASVARATTARGQTKGTERDQGH